MALDNGVLGMSGRNTDLNLGVFAGEVREGLGEEGPEEVAGQSQNQRIYDGDLKLYLQHAPRAAAVVAVVEVKAFAL